jgi:1-acyl-sn-glycerol-3-phosphate acyltransferase
LPFHAALFQSAIDAAAPVVPLMLLYRDRRGHPSRAPAYVGETTMWQSLWAIARASGLVAELCVLPAIATQTATRQALAAQCHDAIARALEQRHGVSLAVAEAAAKSPQEQHSDRHAPFTVA